MNKQIVIFFTCFLLGNALSAQENTGGLIITDTIQSKNDDINPLAPAKAAFYSAIFPGMGQLYNKKYWKMPIVYIAIGTSLYFYTTNNASYHEFRDVYKRRLAGYNDDEYQYLDDQRLIDAQRFYQKNRDISAMVTVAFYILQIVDANVDAHLMQFNVDDDLSIRPDILQNDRNYKPNVGLTINYRF